jgi:aspartyl-tRNA synthetase
LDIETSFLEEDRLFDIIERMMSRIFREVLEISLTPSFPALTYDEAIARFGVDKPDIRFRMELVDLTDIVKDTGFGVFRSAVEAGGIVKALKVERGERLSRNDLDDLRDFAAIYGGKGVAYTRIKDAGEWQSPIAKFLSPEERFAINDKMQAVPGDVILFGADSVRVVNDVLGILRNSLAKKRAKSRTENSIFSG